MRVLMMLLLLLLLRRRRRRRAAAAEAAAHHDSQRGAGDWCAMRQCNAIDGENSCAHWKQMRWKRLSRMSSGDSFDSFAVHVCDGSRSHKR